MRETQVKCEGCGRTIPRHRSAPVFKRVFGEQRKVYYCIGCAKHRGIKFQESKRRVKFGFKRKGPVRPQRKPKTRD